MGDDQRGRPHRRVIPPLVAAYLERALPRGRRVVRQVRIEQEGEMMLKPGASPRRFTATQRLAADRVGFSWQARFPIIPLIALKVVDEYVDGAGRLEVRLLGRTLQRQQGHETSVGEALRYLAELPLVPHALAGNDQLVWQELDDRRVSVSTRVGSASATVELEFGADGDIVRAGCAARPYRQGETWVPTPWEGEYADYRELGGIRMPTRAEVAWDLPGGRFVYWRGRIVAARPLDTPFRPRL